ncbi:AAA family ATPase [uncultured Shewanella sp.]|uniref:AAA family ATPase n=1 Tax=uncultured Shewanella sp. TaxID=173975 RepID=UPI002623E626|nr:AAA family ATPase [uncultured Shewanella sp.]
MSTLHDDYISDLQDSLTSPLLLEIQKKHILQLKQDVPEFSEVVTYHSIYNAELPHNNKTNIITINAEAGKNTQIFSTIYHLIGDELRNKLLIDSALKFSIFFAAQGVGDFLGDVMNSKVSDTFKKTFSWLNESLSDNPLADTAINSVVDKPVDIVSGQIEDLAVKGADKANDKHTLGRKLYLSDTAQAEMRALATQMSEEQTPHQVMQFLLKLLIALGAGAPKLIVINNPFNLDAASIALLSLYFSHAKDAKQSVTKTEGDKAAATHPGVSVLFNYTEQQPFDALPENDTKQKLTRLRHMVQRYGMLEKPGASIPVPAIRATTFVGRTAELRQLITEHEKFIKDCHANESPQVTSQWTLVKGEPGTGKTALVKKHLDTLFAQSDALASSQVRLTLLNQTGHSSEITGLASLQHAIQLELVRLTEEYKKQLGYFERKIKDKCIEWENAKAQFGQINDATSSYKTQYEALKNNRVAALKGIKKAVKFISDLSGFGSMHDGATSAWNASAINQHQSQSVDALTNESNKNAKQEQFDSLFIAIKELKNVSKFIDAKAGKSPILLFVDDLQWIDELSSEFILTQLATRFSTEIIFTARYSDSNTSYKLALKNQQHSPYKLALFDAIKLNKTISEANTTDCLALIPDSIKINAQILIEGMNKRTLQALIEQAYAINDDNTSSLIAEKLISVLTEQEITADTQVVTLFAVEALNLISDARFYQRKVKDNVAITPLFTQLKKGAFRLNVLSTAQISATIENVFTRLHDTHQHAFTHSNAQDNDQTYFTLSSYAVMEERLLIIHDYFSEGDIQYGDAAVFSLQLSALIGAPFDSSLVAHLIEKLTAVDISEYPALIPLKVFLQQEKGSSLKEEHVEILEEGFEILRRLQPNRHHYRHSLFNVFLTQQIKSNLHTIFKSNIESINLFLRYCVQLLDKKHGSNIDSYENTPIDDPQLNISIFGFDLHPESWSSEVSNRLDSYGKYATGNYLASTTSYIKMIKIIPAQEKLIEYYEAIELDFEDETQYVSNLLDISVRYFAMNGDDNVLQSSNTYKSVEPHNRYSSTLGIETLKKVVTFIDNDFFLDCHFESFVEALIILIGYYRKHQEYEKALPLQYKLVSLNEVFSHNEDFAYIYISNTLELYDTHIKLGSTENVSYIEDRLLSIFRYLKEKCNHDGVISKLCISVDCSREDILQVLPINNINSFKNTLSEVSLFFIETYKDEQKERVLRKILDFYDEVCFEEADFFIENYIQVVKLVNTTVSISNDVRISINEKAIDWCKQAREYVGEQWYELEQEHEGFIDLTSKCFHYVATVLLEQYKHLEPHKTYQLSLTLISITSNFDLFYDAKGVALYQELLKLIVESENMNDTSACITLSDFMDSYLIRLVQSIKLKSSINEDDFIEIIKVLYLNYILPYSTVEFTSQDRRYIGKCDSVGFYIGGDYSNHSPYSRALTQLSLVFVLTQEYTYASQALYLSLTVDAYHPYNTDWLIQNAMSFFSSLNDMPLVDSYQKMDILIKDSYLEGNANSELFKQIYRSILEQELTVDELSRFLECKDIFIHLESITTEFDEELQLLLARFDDLCYRRGAFEQMTLFN